ncbi:C-C chemokine receptor type 6-like [Mugil cephalus]|uniref:C-C chemokine receptor type 6-like n=1 Tax=Mugil cephalus TaxID=48193 RepID=UPI001FB762A2|nr:C-C chemokine receptor type 6-like [Mugil cephalus]
MMNSEEEIMFNLCSNSSFNYDNYTGHNLVCNTTVYNNYTSIDDDIDDYEVSSPCSHDDTDRTKMVVGPYIHSIICVLGLVGNGLVIVTYACYKRTKSMTDVYLLNVAVADLLFVVVLPLIVYNELSSWSMGRVACKLLRGSYSINLYSGMLLLACISADRYVAIVQARRSFRLRSPAYSRLTCAIVWTVSILVSIPTICFYDWYVPRHSGINNSNSSDINNISNSSMEDSPSSPEYVCAFKFEHDKLEVVKAIKVVVPSIQLAVGFFLPLTIMIVCYSAIIATLLKPRNFQRHKAVRVVLVVVAVFIVCHLPYNMALLYDTASMFRQTECVRSDMQQTSLLVLESVAYLHCCLNPLLYAFVGVKFRNHFQKIFQDLWCLGKRYMAPRRFSRVTSEVYVSTMCRSVDGSSDAASSFTM